MSTTLIDQPFSGQVNTANLSLAEYRCTDTADLDDYRAQPGNWNVQVSQLAPGKFRSKIHALRYPGLVAYSNQWGAATLVRGQSPDGLLMMGTNTNPMKAEMSWCGQRADHQKFACAPPMSEIEFHLSAAAQDVVLLIDPELLRQVIGQQAADTFASRHHFLFDAGPGKRLIKTIQHHLEETRVAPQALEDPLVSGQIASSLLRCLEDLFAGDHSEAERLPTDYRRQAAYLAIEHITNLGGRTTALEAARTAQVSQRTLEYALRESVGITPGKFIAVTRLNTAHHQLASARRDTTVVNVALSCGFIHLGRFSKAYRRLFGELPSQTLGKRSEV